MIKKKTDEQIINIAKTILAEPKCLRQGALLAMQIKAMEIKLEKRTCHTECIAQCYCYFCACCVNCLLKCKYKQKVGIGSRMGIENID